MRTIKEGCGTSQLAEQDQQGRTSPPDRRTPKELAQSATSGSAASRAGQPVRPDNPCSRWPAGVRGGQRGGSRYAGRTPTPR